MIKKEIVLRMNWKILSKEDKKDKIIRKIFLQKLIGIIIIKKIKIINVNIKVIIK